MKKSDFMPNSPDHVSLLEVEYAFKKYSNLESKDLMNYFKKIESLDIFLLNIERIANKAFYYFLPKVFEYIESQSIYWYDSNVYHDYANNGIDDSAMSAFEIFPRIIHQRSSEHYGDLNDNQKNILITFVDWANHNIDKFDNDIFAKKSTTKKEYENLWKMYGLLPD